MNTKLFTSELAFVSGAVEKKPTIPILSNVLIEKKKKAVTLTATNLEIAAVSAFRDDNTGAIRCTTSSKMLAKSLASLKGVQEFDVTTHGQRITVGAGGFTTSLATMSPDSYPELPKLPDDGGIALPYETLSTMLTVAKHCVSNEESRFTLNGVLLELDKRGLRVVATDGHRLCLVEHPFTLEGNGLLFIVRSELIPMLAKLSKGGQCIVYQVPDHQMFVGFPGEGVSRLLLQRHLSGNFPDYNSVLPKDFKFKSVVNREEFLRVVKQIIPMTDERSRAGKLTLANTLGASSLKVEASVSETGSAKATIGVGFDPGCEHGSVTVGFNLEYLEDALTALKSCETVTLCLNDPHSAGGIDGNLDGGAPNGITVRETIMPMRI